MPLSNEQHIDVLRRMWLMRFFDEKAIQLYGEGRYRGSTHPYIAQEATALGVCAALEPDDLALGTYRGHGLAIAKGADPRQMMAELLGKAAGLCGGKGGSMHFSQVGIGFLGSNAIVAGHIAIAGGVALGKVTIAALSAFSLVFFRYRGRVVIFWLVFITLMLPLEVRIVPTYAVAANALSPYQSIFDVIGITSLIESLTGYRIALQWGLLNTYTGLILPLIATATGTFLYRQFFMTIPNELVEAAKVDGAGPIVFLRAILIPLSTTNIAALATIMFVWAWNQYLWPLLVTTDSSHGTAVMELRELIPGAFGIPDWNVAMAGTLIIMLPPLAVVIFMQRWFVRGLIATEK